MQNTIIAILLFVAVSGRLAGQDLSHSRYDWQAEPQLVQVDDSIAALVLKDARIIEYAYSDNGNLLQYVTKHKIVKVNNDQAIEAFNKVFLPVADVLEFVKLKARSISPDGRVRELDEDNIKQLDNVKDYGSFKIFAIEGVEKGGEIEYIYTTKSLVRDPYGREIFQDDVGVKEAVFELIAPANLLFEAKSYNGFPQPEAEVSDSADLRILSLKANDLPPLTEESYSNYRANLMKVDYKLTLNNNSPKRERLYTWSSASKWFGDVIYDYDQAAGKKLSKLYKELKLKKMGEEDKIKTLENYVKDNIAIKQGSGFEYINPADILDNKYASEVGVNRLFAAMLSEAGIGHELVVTSNRFNSRFDKDFEGWSNFTEVLFYFPEYKKYVSPGLLQYRYGFPPYQFADNYGLFIDGDSKLGKVKHIDMPDAESSLNRIDATINFDGDFATNIDIKQAWTGYRAAEYRAIYNIQKMPFANDLITSGMVDAEVNEIELHNENMDLTAGNDLEFAIDGKLTVNSLIEKAGSGFLFKIGEVIGPQVELYQEQERQNDIDMPYPTYYKRTITFKVPDGYELKGVEEVVIDEFVELDGKKVNRFFSNYQIDGDMVTVTANEYYDKIGLPKEQYDAFRKVINAAADFNKVVFVFEKK